MLTAIMIENFKAFAESQRVPIRPLTLIYGANSSGKSSIIHSLLFARHAAEIGQLDIHLTKIGGDAVDLGGFKQFIHGRNNDLRVQLGWEISNKGFSERLLILLPIVNKVNIGLTFGLSGYDKGLYEILKGVTPRQLIKALIDDAKEKGDLQEYKRLESKLEESEDKFTMGEVARLKSTLRIESFWLDIDGKRFLTASARSENNLRLDTVDYEHNVFKYLVENIILSYSTSLSIDQTEVFETAKSVDELVPNISFEIGKFFPERLLFIDKSGLQTKGLSLLPVSKENRREDLKKVISSYLPGILEEIVIGISAGIKDQLAKVVYLGPLRTYPPRHIGLSETNDPNWEAGGGSAWEFVRKDYRLRQKVNKWLSDENKLSTSYELRIRHLVTIENLKAKITELSTKSLDKGWKFLVKDEPDENGVYRDPYEIIEEGLNEVPDLLQKMETLFAEINELVIYDRRSKTIVSHKDVGIGISQVLPVIVTAYSSKQKLIAIEQPEIHLHPALQAELGDVFIESALGENKNTFLIETHSEHLLLRIMRRIRETTSGNLPEGLLPIKPEDVMILFVEPDGSRSIVREMPLNERGDLVKEWPGGFFEEDFKELF